MTEGKTVKISEETYARLSEIAGELQIRLKRRVSLDEAIRYLLSLRGKGMKITDLAGSWDVSEEEVAQMRASLTEAWKKWRLPETLNTFKDIGFNSYSSPIKLRSFSASVQLL